MSAITHLATAMADRYRIERELGQGGMATVYLAQDLKHDRKVALKVLKPELAAVLGAERFLTEIKTTANLQHPHILPLFDSGAAESYLFYVMPFVEGESLRDRLTREKQLPIADAIRIAKEVASALDYAHRHGVIHRDIKPENVMLHDGSALVADFGIALAASKAGGSRMTETGMSLGTPHYMSPEQAMGEREITARSDVYALGAMTYEMLVGDPPFIGSTAQAIVAKVLTEKPAPPSSFRETVPEPVEDAVLTALAKLPADRWPTAAAFIEALEGHAEATHARATSRARGMPAVPLNPWNLRAPLPWAVAFGVATLAAVWGWWSPSARPDDVVRLELESSPNSKIAFPVAGVATHLAISPDGRMIVYAGEVNGGGWRLFLRKLDQLAGRPLAGTEGGFNPEFSPDGQWIAFRAGDGKLKKIASDGSGLTTVCPIDNYGSVSGGITWISNQEIVFSRGTYSEGRGLWRVSADGGQPVLFTQLDSASGERIQLAPRAAEQGRLVFYSSTVAGNADHRIGVISTATGKPTVFSGFRGVRAIGLIDGLLLYVRLDGALMAVPFDAGNLSVGEPIQVADSIAIPPSAWTTPIALSSSGSLIYQKGGIAGQLVSVSRGETRVVLDSVQMYLHPRLSPGGDRIAVEIQSAAGADIWITDLKDHTTERLTREGFNNRPEWTPDGSRVLYTSSRDPADALWLQPADGSASGMVVVRDSNPIREGVITPDGQSVVYRVDTRETNRDLYRMPLTGGPATPILNGINDDKQPRVSPDGKWLAYVSNETGREEVYVRALSGAGGRVPVSVGGGSEPLWAENGRRLFYRFQTRVMAATLATGAAPAVIGREQVFEGDFASDLFHPNYDVTADGQTFIMIRPVEENRGIVLVVNWIEELRRRTGGGR